MKKKKDCIRCIPDGSAECQECGNLKDEIKNIKIKKAEIKMPEISGYIRYEYPLGRQPHCCPVCMGKGIVSAGFYESAGKEIITTSNAAPVKCRSCNGTGIIWG